MTDNAREPELALDPTDLAVEQIIPPEQAPMDDAAGGPSIDKDDDSFEDGAEQTQSGE